MICKVVGRLGHQEALQELSLLLLGESGLLLLERGDLGLQTDFLLLKLIMAADNLFSLLNKLSRVRGFYAQFLQRIFEHHQTFLNQGPYLRLQLGNSFGQEVSATPLLLEQRLHVVDEEAALHLVDHAQVLVLEAINELLHILLHDLAGVDDLLLLLDGVLLTANLLLDVLPRFDGLVHQNLNPWVNIMTRPIDQ